MKIDGKCHCGFIAFEAEIDPNDVSICHCADCQKLSGSPYRASVAAAPENFRITAGELAVYIKTADSGRKRAQGFCPKCGSPIYATGVGDPKAAYNIRVGVTTQRDQLVPHRQVWKRSAQKWIGDVANLPEA